MGQANPHRDPAILLATTLVCAVLGSVHAFSVLLPEIERAFSVGRAGASLTYSLALISLTVVVLLGPRLYGQVRPAGLLAISGGLAAIGLLMAAFAPALIWVWLGFGVIFGAANGLGYGFCLQFAAQADPGHEGRAMGLVTAAYAFGAVLTPVLFEYLILSGGIQAALLGLTAILGISFFNAIVLVQRSGRRYKPGRKTVADLPWSDLTRLWLSYTLAVFAGLMAIGHAAPIAQFIDPASPAWIAPAVLAACNLCGAIVAGAASDRMRPRVILVALPLISALALGVLATGWGAYICLGLIGFAYGGTIAAYPAVIAKSAPRGQGAAIYGLVFTGWGSAGLIAPWLAGILFDSTSSYGAALWLAALLGLLSAASAAVAFDPERGKF